MFTINAITYDFVNCVTEQAFKMSYINKTMRNMRNGNKIFCIETEETIAGFPDVLELWTANLQAGSCTQAFFYEFKFSDKNGNIKFQSTQPAFYKQNRELNIKVIAYNQYSKRVHVFSTNEIFDKESPYYTINARINLCNVEKEVGV